MTEHVLAALLVPWWAATTVAAYSVAGVTLAGRHLIVDPTCAAVRPTATVVA